jgi:hypothetical protein
MGLAKIKKDTRLSPSKKAKNKRPGGTGFVFVKDGRLVLKKIEEKPTWDDTVTDLMDKYDQLWQRLADA